MSTDPIPLRIVEVVDIPGHGLLYIVANTAGLADPGKLCGQEILLDGMPVRVTGVETFAVARPYPERLPFGLRIAVEYPEDQLITMTVAWRAPRLIWDDRPVLPVTGEIDTHEVRLDG